MKLLDGEKKSGRLASFNSSKLTATAPTSAKARVTRGNQSLSIAAKVKVPGSMGAYSVFGGRIEPSLPRPLRERVFSLERPADWDGRGSGAVLRADCRAASSFLQVLLDAGLPEPSFLAPSPKGGVSFTWRSRRNLVGVQVCARTPDEVYYQWGGPTSFPKTGTVKIDRFARMLARMPGLKG